MLSSTAPLNIDYDATTLGSLTDHIYLYVCIPMQNIDTLHQQPREKQVPRIVYKWNEGTCVQDYADAATAWGKYTDTVPFRNAFLAIVDDVSISNDARATRVEEFFLTEAVLAGVVRKIEIRRPRNPNKWSKTLSPWFT
jgi:hypothetical protein